MVKKILVIVFVLIVESFSFAAWNAVSLPDILRPKRMVVGHGNVYILDQSHEVSVYSLDTLKKIASFGKKGAGPGEFKFLPVMRIFPDYVFLGIVEKFAFFSPQGKMIKEQRMPREGVLVPVGKQYAIFYFGFEKDRSLYSLASIYDNQMKKVREFYRRKSPPPPMMIMGSTARRGQIKILNDHFSIHSAYDKIFIAEAAQGFFIDVFDSQGKRLYTIDKKDLKKIPITSDVRQTLINQYLEDDPGMKKNWKEYTRFNDVIIPDSFPPMKNVVIADEKIYVATYETREKFGGFVVLDLQGQVLQELFLPRSDIYTFKDNTYYYLVENEEAEEWELHITPVDLSQK